MNQRRAILVITILLVAIQIFAETIYLKDGTILKGTITKTDETTITIETKAGVLTVDKADVDRVDYNDQSSQQSQTESPNKPKALEASLFFNPLSMIVAPLLLNTIDVNLGQMTSIGGYFLWSLEDFFDYNESTGLLASELQIGVFVNPLGKHLNGPYAGLIGAWSVLPAGLPNAFSVLPEVGFQWAFGSGFYIGGYLGYAYTLPPYSYGSIKYGINIGIAWSNQALIDAWFPKQAAQ